MLNTIRIYLSLLPAHNKPQTFPQTLTYNSSWFSSVSISNWWLWKKKYGWFTWTNDRAWERIIWKSKVSSWTWPSRKWTCVWWERFLFFMFLVNWPQQPAIYQFCWSCNFNQFVNVNLNCHYIILYKYAFDFWWALSMVTLSCTDNSMTKHGNL